MKRLFLLLISLVLAGNFLMIAQDKKVVAVIARGKGLPVEVSLSPVVDKFVDALRQSTENNYQVVDRSDDFMQFVDFELRYQASGLVDDTQLATIGKRLGADLVCGVLVERS